ncbi:MAG: hypothetical protein IJS39_06510 [Synergistaceae bacterium]|nr:hypothetical protein [Synergistaceae bacterium]
MSLKEFILPRQKGVRAVKLFVEILKAAAMILKYLAEVIRAIDELKRSKK